MDVLNGPFRKASPLDNPDLGEHYRIVFADAVVGRKHMSRMDVYAGVDLCRVLLDDGLRAPLPVAVARVIPTVVPLQERLVGRRRCKWAGCKRSQACEAISCGWE